MVHVDTRTKFCYFINSVKFVALAVFQFVSPKEIHKALCAIGLPQLVSDDKITLKEINIGTKQEFRLNTNS